MLSSSVVNGTRMEDDAARIKELNDSFLRELELSKSDLIPSEFICPLTLNIMVDPVVIASNQTYERNYIERWFSEGHRTCPKTNRILPHTNTTSNASLRVAIATWCKDNGIVLSNKVWPEEKVGEKNLRDTHSEGREDKDDCSQLKTFSSFKKKSLTLQMKESPADSEPKLPPKINLLKPSLDTAVEPPNAQTCVSSTSSPSSPLSAEPSPTSQPPPTSIFQKNGSPAPHLDKLITSRSFKSHRLNKFKQMMISFSNAGAEDGPSPPHSTSSSPNSSDRSDTSSPQAPQAAVVPTSHKPPNKPSLRVPNLNLPKLPIPPSQVQDFAGYPTPTKSGFGSRKHMSLVSPRALDPTGRPLHDMSDSSSATIAVDPFTETEIRSVLDKIRDQASVEELRSASEKMRSLSKASTSTRLKIHELGGIPKLISFLASSDKLTVENAVTALLNLALEFKLKIEIVKMGALRPFASILSDQSQPDQTRGNAAGALCSLSVAEENREIICSEGIVPLLADVLRRGKSPRGMKDACIGLFNLAITPMGKKLIIQTGIVTSLLKYLSDDLPIEEEVMALLANLSKAEEVCETIEEQGGIPTLVGVLENGSPRSKLSVVSILHLMSGKQSARNIMWEEGAIPCLSTMTQGVINDRAKEKILDLLKVLRS